MISNSIVLVTYLKSLIYKWSIDLRFWRAPGLVISHQQASLYTARRQEMIDVLQTLFFYLLTHPMVHSPISDSPFQVNTVDVLDLCAWSALCIVQSIGALEELSLLYFSCLSLVTCIVLPFIQWSTLRVILFFNFLKVPCWGYPMVGFLQSAPQIRLPVPLTFRLDLSSQLACLHAKPGSSCHGALTSPEHVHHTTGFMKRNLWREYLRRYNDQINFHFKCYQN